MRSTSTIRLSLPLSHISSSFIHPGPPGDAGPSSLDCLLMGDDGEIEDPKRALSHLASDGKKELRKWKPQGEMDGVTEIELRGAERRVETYQEFWIEEMEQREVVVVGWNVFGMIERLDREHHT
ncbi:hypothetical protein BT69DRAFT_1342312 [Atractiella rhizophila]|nr:hypothetical protein BT69DRAFT_1342312 [Atractiella rhizophila]